MKKLLILLLPAFFWAASDVITRFASSKVNTIVGTFLLSLGMVIAMGVAIFLFQMLQKKFQKFHLSMP